MTFKSCRSLVGGLLPALLVGAFVAQPVLAATSPDPARGDKAKSKALETYARLPLRFEPNQGQTDPQVRFLTRGGGYSLFLTSGETVLAMSASETQKAAVLRTRLVGANPNAELVGVAPLPGKSNYLVGRDRSAWHTGIPQFARVEYRQVYPGVDLAYYGSESQLEYDFIVAPKADPRAIRFRIDGAETLSLDRDGNLVARANGRDIVHRSPVVYQESKSARKAVAARYILDGANVSFNVGSYDRGKPLYIDPVVLIYSTYLGGGQRDQALGVTVDTAGDVYVAGLTNSVDFPGSPTTLGTVENHQAFVVKLTDTGSVLYTTLIGGSATDVAYAVSVDSLSRAWVVGSTASTDFPVSVDAFQPSAPGAGNGFAMRLNDIGSDFEYSTYLGGSLLDEATGVAVLSDQAYVAGSTMSGTDFPAFTTVIGPGGSKDAFAVKLDPSLCTGCAIYSTRIGGSGFDTGAAIAVDSGGDAYITGQTQSSLDLPTTFLAFQTSYGGGVADAYLARLDASGSFLNYATYLGGSDVEEGWGVALDDSSSVYVTGYTKSSTDFPTTGVSPAFGGGIRDAFVARFDTSVFGGPLVWSRYLGGSGGNEFGRGASVDPFGNVWVAGNTDSADFPTVNPLQASSAGGLDAFATKLDSAGNALFSTYLGGPGDDIAHAIAGSGGTAHVVGNTGSTTGFPTKNPAYGTFGGGADDAFAARLPAALDVVSPNGGENFAKGSKREITFSHSLGTGASVTVAVRTGATVTPIAGCPTTTAPVTSTCLWDPVAIPGGGTSNNVRIRVTWNDDPTLQDESDAPFNVLNPSLVLTNPNSAQTWIVDQTKQVTWNSNLGPLEYVAIQLSGDGGATLGGYSTVAIVPASPGSYDFTTLAANISDTSRFRINWATSGVDPTPHAGATCPVPPAVTGGVLCDVSNNNFRIRDATVNVGRPNTNVNWTYNTLENIQWTSNFGAAEFVKIELSSDGGATFPHLIANAHTNTSPFVWTVGKDEFGVDLGLATGLSSANRIRIKRVNAGGGNMPSTVDCDATTPTTVGCDISNVNFRINSAP